ncbi:MAG: hypothetical protein ABI193_10465 [Minicystis sp.]
MKRLARVAVAASLALAASACRPATFGATPGDYADYRATRLGTTVDDRLLAAEKYLTRHPEGVWIDEVRAYHDRIEPLYYGRKQDTIGGLETYLRALPEGPHRMDAGRRLEGLRAAQDAGSGVVAAGDVTAKLDKASADRAKVHDDIALWIERFLDVDLWMAPLSEAKATLIIPWSLSLPMPTCAPIKAGSLARAPALAARRCAKLLEMPYTVVVGGAPEDREATLEIAVIQDEAGRPLQVSIGGPDLFLRLEETFTVRAMQPGDPERKAASIRRAVDLVRETFGRAVSRAPACEQPAAGPQKLDLACRGVRAQVRPAVTGGEDDAVLISPL